MARKRKAIAPAVPAEPDFPSLEAAIAHAVSEGAQWRDGRPESNMVALWRPSSAYPGSYGRCVIFRRSFTGDSNPVWSRACWLLDYDGLPADAVKLETSEAKA